MNREFLLNISFLILVNVIIKPIYILAIEVNVQNAVGFEDYGIYFSLFNFCFLFQIINDLGIQNYNSRMIAQNPKDLSKNVRNILGTKLILAILFLATIFIFALILGYNKSFYHLLFWVALNQIILSFLLYTRSNIAASGLYRMDSIISVLDKVILILILSYLLWFRNSEGPFQIEWFIYAQTVAYSISMLTSLLINRKLANSLSISISWPFSRGLLKKSFPYALVIFLMIAYTRMDGIMLERLLDDKGFAAGVYAAGFRLLEASNMIGFLFAGLLLPMFSSLINKREQLESLFETSFSLIFSISFILFSSCLFFRNEIMSFLYPGISNPDFGLLLSYLMTSYIAMSMGYIFGTLITSSGDLKKMNLLFIFGIILNFSLNLYLIPSQQYLGAAVATIVTQYFVVGGQYFLVKKKFNFRFDPMRFLNHILFAIMILGIFYVSAVLIDIPWMLKLIIGIILAFITALVFKLIDLSKFRETFVSHPE